MGSRPIRWAALVAGAFAAIPCVASADPSASTQWTPALAAWGQGPTSPGTAASAPLLQGALATVAAVDPNPAAQQPPVVRTTNEAAPDDETQHWVPSLAAINRIIGLEAEGSVNSTSLVRLGVTSHPLQTIPHVPPFVCPPRTPTCSTPKEPAPTTTSFQTRSVAQLVVGTGAGAAPSLPAASSALMLTPAMLGSVEVMTPGLQSLPGRPRLFAHGDAGPSFSFQWSVAKQGAPAKMGSMTQPLGTSEGRIDGQGSETQSQLDTWVYGAGLGAAFTFNLGERRLRIKPSAEYTQYDTTVTGALNRAYTIDNGRSATNNSGPAVQNFFPGTYPEYPSLPVQFLPVVVSASKTQTYHGIGPGLELEMDAARAGPIMLALFLQGQAYYMLDNNDVTFTGRTTLTDPHVQPNPQTVDAQFSYHQHTWTYSGGLGLRFRWNPEPGWSWTSPQ